MELQTALVKSDRSTGVQRQSSPKFRQSAWRLHKDICRNTATTFVESTVHEQEKLYPKKYVRLWEIFGRPPLGVLVNEVTTASRSSASCNISCWFTVAGVTEGLCPHMAFGKVAAFIEIFDNKNMSFYCTVS